jgi:putative Holliday junction resolvase
VAVSDDLGLYAHPRPAINGRSPKDAVRAVARLVSEERIAEVFVGLPLTLRGARGHRAESFEDLIASLRSTLTVPVTEIDERLSSAQAVALNPALADRRDGSLDSASAAVILQAVLDSRRQAVRR